jgi:hypothetical protein
MLWLIASESLDGTIEMEPKNLAFRIRVTEAELMNAVKPLIENNFFEGIGAFSISVLAPCKQDASNMLAQSTEYRVQSNSNSKPIAHQNSMSELPGFETFWENYPKKVGKGAARVKWLSKVKDDANWPAVIAGLECWKQSEQWQDIQYVPYPATFLNQMRWQDEVPKSGGKRERQIEQSIRETIELAKHYGVDEHCVEVGRISRSSLQPEGAIVLQRKGNLR